MAPPRSHGVVSLPALDLRHVPSHRAELASQLLLGEIVRCLETRADGQWTRVENRSDRYRGWVRSWGLVFASRVRASRWGRRATARVACPVAEVMTGRGRGALVSPLFFNSRVIPVRVGRRTTLVELPDARRGWVRSSALARGRATATLLERVRTLLGSPYHWGGRIPSGYDCSAFVQQLLLEQGTVLPRDCVHQFRASRRLGRSVSPRVGDLVFFAAPGKDPSHVGVGLGAGYFAHCRGRVMISSLDLDNQLCANELIDMSLGWRRPVPAPIRRTRTHRTRGETA
jgi:cell wall-associated NlpC family hydrolase